MGQKEGMGNTVFSCGKSWVAEPHEGAIECILLDKNQFGNRLKK